MFAGDEVRVDVGFAQSAARLAILVRDGSLARASHAAWGEGIARVRPSGLAWEQHRLVKACFLGPNRRGMVVTMMLRWEVTGLDGTLFPALDADVTLIPDGSHAILIGLDGVYRPSAVLTRAEPDAAIVQRVAAATIRSFLGEVAHSLTMAVPPLAGGPETVGACVRAA